MSHCHLTIQLWCRITLKRRGSENNCYPADVDGDEGLVQKTAITTQSRLVSHHTYSSENSNLS